jgi:mitogen-activated protein kinase organizer 1
MMDLVGKFDCGQGAVRAIRFNKDGNYCITCGADKTVKLWNPYTRVRIQTFTGHNMEVMDADCSIDHSFVCTGSADKAVLYFDVKTAKMMRKLRGHVGM